MGGGPTFGKNSQIMSFFLKAYHRTCLMGANIMLRRRWDLESGSDTMDKFEFSNFSVVFESQIQNPTSLQPDICC